MAGGADLQRIVDTWASACHELGIPFPAVVKAQAAWDDARGVPPRLIITPEGKALANLLLAMILGGDVDGVWNVERFLTAVEILLRESPPPTPNPEAA